MLKLLIAIGALSFFSGGALAALGYKEIALKLMPLGFSIAVIAIVLYFLLKPLNSFQYNTGIGTKICVVAFAFMGVPGSIDFMINGPGQNIGDTLFSYGFPVFAFGMLLNIYNMYRNGAF